MTGPICPSCSFPTQERKAGNWCQRCRGWVVWEGFKTILINSTERLGIYRQPRERLAGEQNG